MLKVGLKLWSINTDCYLREAKRLYSEGVFDYIELYVVPGSLSNAKEWKSFDIPYVVHAPHSVHGVNLADKNCENKNINIFSDVKKFADALNASTIIVHGGVLGSVDEVARQIILIGDSRIAIENKPYFPIDNSDKLLAGSTPEEIQKIITATDCGFCFDIGHAVASANAHEVHWKEYFESFLKFNPKMYHLSDMHISSKKDQHLHFGTGTLPIKEIAAQLSKNAYISVETKKVYTENLDDFKEDVKWLRDLK
jgi:sugar phosphate isomerase/epimerase